MKKSGLSPARFLTSALLLGFLATPSLAQVKPQEVGNVVDIDGPRLYSDRLKQKGWFQGYAGMRTYLKERLRTDKETQAVLGFLVGGRAGIGPGTQVEIVSPEDISRTGSTLRVDKGTFWAKFDKQEKEFRIETSGGVIGIEGTELLVGVDEKGVTEVLLFEGQVSVVDKKGNKKTMLPGDYAEFGGPKGMCVLSYPSASLRTLVVERFPKFSSFIANQNVTSIPKPASPTLIRGFNRSRDGLLSVLKKAEGSSGGAAPSNLNVVKGAPPSFRWEPVQGAFNYAFFLSSDSDGEDILFSSRVDLAGFTMPEGAQGLEPGNYYFSVVALDENGNPMGRPTQSSFQTSGWSGEGVSLSDEAE